MRRPSFGYFAWPSHGVKSKYAVSQNLYQEKQENLHLSSKSIAKVEKHVNKNVFHFDLCLSHTNSFLIFPSYSTIMEVTIIDIYLVFSLD